MMGEHPPRSDGPQQPGVTNRTLWLVVVVIVVATIVIGVLGLTRGAGDLQVPAVQEPMERTFALSSDLVNGSNRYHPATLVAFAGDDIIFAVTNRGESEHGFTVSGLDISDVIAEGDAGQYTATDVPAGVYAYFCHLHPGHIGGQLIVFDR
jgi:plastocyanin